MMTYWRRFFVSYWFRQQRVHFYEDFARFCMSNLSFWAVLHFFYERARSRRQWIAYVYQDMLASLKQGSLSKAISLYIPHMEYGLLYAYESANCLPEGLLYLSHLVSHMQAFRIRCYQMLSKHVVPLMIFIFLQVGFYECVAPMAKGLIPLSQWPLESFCLYQMSAFLVTHLPLLLLLLILMIAGVWWSLKRWRPGPVRLFFDRYVPVYRLYRRFQAYSFLIALSHLLSIRMSLLGALQLLQEHGSDWLSVYIDRMIHRLSYCSTQYGEAFQVGFFESDIEDRLIFAAEQSYFAECMIDLGQKNHAMMIEKMFFSMDSWHTVGLLLFAVLIVGSLMGFYDLIFLLQTHISS